MSAPRGDDADEVYWGLLLALVALLVASLLGWLPGAVS